MNQNPCFQEVSHSKISFSDKRSACTLTIINPRKTSVEMVKVDSCLIKNGMRCDFAAVLHNQQRTWLIELKGKDVNHAINQMESTHTDMKSRIVYKIDRWVVVCTQCPIPSTMIQRHKKRVQKKYSAILEIHKRKCEIPI